MHSFRKSNREGNAPHGPHALKTEEWRQTRQREAAMQTTKLLCCFSDTGPRNGTKKSRRSSQQRTTPRENWVKCTSRTMGARSGRERLCFSLRGMQRKREAHKRQRTKDFDRTVTRPDRPPVLFESSEREKPAKPFSCYSRFGDRRKLANATKICVKFDV
jgi:hypothetical protein